MEELVLNKEQDRTKNSHGNDIMLILDGDKVNENIEIEDLMEEFAQELKPIGIACKTWTKP